MCVHMYVFVSLLSVTLEIGVSVNVCVVYAGMGDRVSGKGVWSG